MVRLSRILAPVLVCAALLAARPAASHEFWIAPEQYQVLPGGTISARLRNGENFEGIELAFFDKRAARHEIIQGQTVTEISSRSGDRPAIVLPDVSDGLVVLAHETTPSRLTYREFAKFEKFAAHKDFPAAVADHIARGLPTDVFSESYTRHVKALIGVGSGAGRDRAVGMETEFVAQSNPYTPDFTQSMRVLLLYKGAPRGDAQVEIFDRAPDGTVEVRLTRTNAEGMAQIDTAPGHEYLIDAVVLRAPERGDDAIVWETLWAALSFAVPEKMPE